MKKKKIIIIKLSARNKLFPVSTFSQDVRVRGKRQWGVFKLLILIVSKAHQKI